MITEVHLGLLGSLAGVIAISIALFLQFVRPHLYSTEWIMGLYLFGGMFVLVNLEPVLADTGYWGAVRLLLYIVVIVLELLLLYDMYDGDPRLLNRLTQDTEYD